jgi:O-methyltransferase involved in polyketide biosynthesis
MTFAVVLKVYEGFTTRRFTRQVTANTHFWTGTVDVVTTLRDCSHFALAWKKANTGAALPVEPVAQTSRWMAAARPRESEHPYPYRLFDDPLAASQAGPEGFDWLERMEQPTPGFGGPALYVAVRTRFFDDFLLYASRGTGVRHIVLLAAGMDARAFRLSWPPGTHLYELDRPEVLTIKEEILVQTGASPACQRRLIEADLGRPS